MNRKYMAYGIHKPVGRIAHLFFNLGWDTDKIAHHLNQPESEIYNTLNLAHERRRGRLLEAS